MPMGKPPGTTKPGESPILGRMGAYPCTRMSFWRHWAPRTRMSFWRHWAHAMWMCLIVGLVGYWVISLIGWMLTRWEFLLPYFMCLVVFVILTLIVAVILAEIESERIKREQNDGN